MEPMTRLIYDRQPVRNGNGIGKHFVRVNRRRNLGQNQSLDIENNVYS